MHQTVDSPKRRRVMSQNRGPSVCHGTPPDNRLYAPFICGPSRHSALVQQVRAAATEEAAMEILMDASCAEESRRKSLRKKLPVASRSVDESCASASASTNTASTACPATPVSPFSIGSTKAACAHIHSLGLHVGNSLGVPQDTPRCIGGEGCDSILPPAVQQEGAFRAGPALAFVTVQSLRVGGGRTADACAQ